MEDTTHRCIFVWRLSGQLSEHMKKRQKEKARVAGDRCYGGCGGEWRLWRGVVVVEGGGGCGGGWWLHGACGEKW